MANNLEPPENFQFPFEPYSIQHDFMTALYIALEEGKLGIFESPTGTGKSMSIICGALTWLEDHEKRVRTTLSNPYAKMPDSDLEDNSDWITQQARQREETKKNAERLRKLKLLDAKEKEVANIIERVAARRRREMEEAKKFNINMIKNDVSETKPEDDLLLEEYSENLEEEESEEEEKEGEEEHEVTKVFLCSRTHSQLSQLASELHRSVHVNKRTACLASRQSYCINPSVRSLGNITLINERCLELQLGNSTTKRDSDGCATKRVKHCRGCPYKVQERVNELCEEILAEINDVEELVKKGRGMKACPYYATRAAVKDAQVVLLPYNTLLHASTREASGISLKGNVVIIDEAHNLLNTIAQMHSTQVRGQQLTDACMQLNRYRSRYEKRFSALNLLRLDQVIFFIGRLLRMLRHSPGGAAIGSVVYHLEEFASAAQVDNINPHVLLEFCCKSRLAQKLRGFVDKSPPEVVVHESKPVKGLSAFLKEINRGSTDPQVEEARQEMAPEAAADPVSKNPILSVLSFLECLTSKSGDGRIVCSRLSTVGPSHLKFLLLNPAEHFRAVVQDARAVIVAGGTMQPLTEFREQLFLAAGGTLDRVTQFSCGHVIPPDNILPITLNKGPTGKQLNFSFESRSSMQMIQEVERLLSNVCNIIPGGIVCFFPSYEYEERVFLYLEKSGALERLQAKKKVFREPKKASQVEQVLRDYAQAIKMAKPVKTKMGALMLSVVGGKLSEGLNFSDDLGRLIIIVGMPYPNSKSAELQEKMNYLDTNVDPGSGKKYYEALCMKAVNQSIGRAIRHQGDYAAVLLADYRYNRPATLAALPGWMHQSIQCCNTFGSCLAQIRQFFKKRGDSY